MKRKLLCFSLMLLILLSSNSGALTVAAADGLTVNISRAWTNGNVTVNISASDPDSGIDTVTTPNGTTTHGGAKTVSQTYVATQNGSYPISTKDRAGNQESVTAVVTSIDRVAPGLTLTAGTAWTNSPVTITATATDADSKVKDIKKPDNSVVASATTTYVATTNGTYSFTTTDHAGNVTTKSITVGNIDILAPTVIITGNPTDWGNTDITLRVSATDNLSGVKRTRSQGGAWTTTTNYVDYIISTNGTYTFEVEDNAGNVKTTSVTVTKIDKVLPTANVTSPTTWTNNPVVITVVGSDDSSGVDTIRTPDNSIVTATSTTYTVTKNGTYSFVIKDKAGNSRTVTHTVSCIDMLSPRMLNITYTELEQPLNPRSRTSFLQKQVRIEATAEDLETAGLGDKSGINRIEYQLVDRADMIDPDGWKVYNPANPPIQAEEFAGFTPFRCWDNAGNVSVIMVDNLTTEDREPIIYHSLDPNIWTQSDITITVEAYDDPAGVAYIIKPDGSRVNFNGDGFVTVTYVAKQNGDYTFQIADRSNNITTYTVAVTNIDRQKPTMVDVTGNPTTWTNQDAVLHFTTEDDSSGVWRIRCNGEDWVYASEMDYVVEYNETTIFEVEDVAHNTNTYRIPVTFIDKTTPEVLNLNLKLTLVELSQSKTKAATTSLNAGSDIVEVDGVLYNKTVQAYATYWASPSGVKLMQYQTAMTDTQLVANGWRTYTTVNPPQVAYSYEGFVYVRCQDLAGNWSLPLKASIITENALPYGQHTLSNTQPTKEPVTITLECFDDLSGFSKVVSPDGTTSNVSTVSYTVSKNGTYSFKIHDVAGNICDYKVLIDTIDFEPPIIRNIAIGPSTLSKDKVDISAVVTDNLGIVSKVEYQLIPKGQSLSLSEWKDMPTTLTLSSAFNGSIAIRAFDVAGNESVTKTAAFIVDKSPPIVVVENLTPGNQESFVILKVSAVDESGIDYMTMADGRIVRATETEYTVSKNGEYTFYAKDNAGNVSSPETYKVTTIDKDGPTLTAKSTPSEWTRGPVVVKVTATSITGVKEMTLPNNGSSEMFEAYMNGNYRITATDNRGHTATLLHQIKNIDLTGPVISGGAINGTLTLTAKDAHSGTANTKLNNENRTGESMTFTVSPNTTYNIESVDNVGNISKATLMTDSNGSGKLVVSPPEVPTTDSFTPPTGSGTDGNTLDDNNTSTNEEDPWDSISDKTNSTESNTSTKSKEPKENNKPLPTRDPKESSTTENNSVPIPTSTPTPTPESNLAFTTIPISERDRQYVELSDIPEEDRLFTGEEENSTTVINSDDTDNSWRDAFTKVTGDNEDISNTSKSLATKRKAQFEDELANLLNLTNSLNQKQNTITVPTLSLWAKLLSYLPWIFLTVVILLWIFILINVLYIILSKKKQDDDNRRKRKFIMWLFGLTIVMLLSLLLIANSSKSRAELRTTSAEPLTNAYISAFDEQPASYDEALIRLVNEGTVGYLKGLSPSAQSFEEVRGRTDIYLKSIYVADKVNEEEYEYYLLLYGEQLVDEILKYSQARESGNSSAETQAFDGVLSKMKDYSNMLSYLTEKDTE